MHKGQLFDPAAFQTREEYRPADFAIIVGPIDWPYRDVAYACKSKMSDSKSKKLSGSVGLRLDPPSIVWTEAQRSALHCIQRACDSEHDITVPPDDITTAISRLCTKIRLDVESNKLLSELRDSHPEVEDFVRGKLYDVRAPGVIETLVRNVITEYVIRCILDPSKTAIQSANLRPHLVFSSSGSSRRAF
ncbi:hypothetical protein Q5752_003800 [Cryptotrichosporon argae]